MQPSEMEIAREMENIRSMRRISSQSGPGSLALDPDLPSTSPPLSPQRRSALPGAALGAVGDEDGFGEDNALADDPSHLFWVPAHLHPELAPGEFRAFLQEHTRTIEEGTPSETPGAMLRRAGSGASGMADGGLGRQRSMLMRQYKPREGDGVGEEEEKIVPVKRTRSIFNKTGPQLTISDLQKLESLADQASKSNDPTELRSVIRRSMSMNLPLSFIDQMDDLPADDADAPIIVPRQTLQRAQRTKIRKPGLPGDGGGHRFAATRRGQRSQPVDGTRPSSDMSSASDHGDEPHPRPGAPNNEIEDELARLNDTLVGARTSTDDPPTDGSGEQRSTSPAETVEDDDLALISSPPSSSFQMRPRSRSPEDPYSPVPILLTKEQRLPMSPSQVELPPSPYPPHTPNYSQSLILQHPRPKQYLNIPGTPPGTARSPSPGGSGVSPPSSPEPTVRSASAPLPDPDPIQPSRQPFVPSAIPTPPGVRKEKDKPKEKEKEKKGGLFGWGGGKEKKKGDKEKISISEKEREKEKEKESGGGFFGFFGGGKKKHDDHIGGGVTHTAGREAAAALLGQSKSKAAGPLMGLIAPGGVPGQYARYPIHVERAIYRLSHIKLANPRRPLYEQVLISNLMFWYLGIVNKPPVPPGGEKPAEQPVAGTGEPNDQSAMVETQSPAPTPTPNADEQAQIEAREQEERERQEQEQLLAEQHELEIRERERAERERLERERLERERAVAVAAAEKEKTKKSGLTKAERAPQSAMKRAEIPVRGPGFDMQHQMIEQEYGHQQQYARQQAAGRSGGSAPVIQPQTSYHLPQRIQHQNHTQQGPPPRPPRGEPPQNTPQQSYFYHQDANQVAYQPMNPYALPPGAKPPAPVENSWAINVASGTTPSASPAASQRHGAGASSDGSLTGRSHSYKAQTQSPAAEYLQAPAGQKPGRSLSANAISTQSSVRSSGAPPAPYHPQAPVHQQHQRHNSQQPVQNTLPSSAYGPPYASSPVLNGSGGQPQQPPPQPHSSGRLVKKKSGGAAIVHGGSSGKDRRKSLDHEPYRQRQNGAPNPEENFSLAMWQQYPVQQQQGYGKQQQLPNGQWGQQSYR